MISHRIFATTATMAAMVMATPAAMAQNGGPPEGKGKPTTPPGNSAANNPHGGPPGITGDTPASGAAQGKPTTPPGNSGSNPHGGPPGITGSGPPGQAEPAVAEEPVTSESNGSEATPNGPDGKITICHATGSEKNPFVRITISVNGLNGHGDHQDGRDIVPAPDGPCEAASLRGSVRRGSGQTSSERRSASRHSSHSSHNSGSSTKRLVRSHAGTGSHGSHSGGTAKVAATSLPFTGLNLLWMVAVAVGLGGGGFLVRGWSRR